MKAVKACADADRLFNAPGSGTRKAIIKGEGGQEDWIFVKEYVTAAGNAIFQKILTDPDWGFWISDEIEEKSIGLMRESTALRYIDFKAITNAELAQIFQDWEDIRREAHQFGMPWNVVEFEDQLVSKYLKRHLEQRIAGKKFHLNTASVFSVLSMPTRKTFAQREDQEMLQLA